MVSLPLKLAARYAPAGGVASAPVGVHVPHIRAMRMSQWKVQDRQEFFDGLSHSLMQGVPD